MGQACAFVGQIKPGEAIFHEISDGAYAAAHMRQRPNWT